MGLYDHLNQVWASPRGLSASEELTKKYADSLFWTLSSLNAGVNSSLDQHEQEVKETSFYLKKIIHKNPSFDVKELVDEIKKLPDYATISSEDYFVKLKETLAKKYSREFPIWEQEYKKETHDYSSDELRDQNQRLSSSASKLVAKKTTLSTRRYTLAVMNDTLASGLTPVDKAKHILNYAVWVWGNFLVNNRFVNSMKAWVRNAGYFSTSLDKKNLNAVVDQILSKIKVHKSDKDKDGDLTKAGLAKHQILQNVQWARDTLEQASQDHRATQQDFNAVLN